MTVAQGGITKRRSNVSGFIGRRYECGVDIETVNFDVDDNSQHRGLETSVQYYTDADKNNDIYEDLSDTEFEHDTDDFSSQISWTKQAFLLDSNNDQDQFLLEMADVITESLI